MKKLCLFVAVILALALAGCSLLPWPAAPYNSEAAYTQSAPSPAPTTPESLTRQQIFDAFEEIAFTGEYGSTTSQIRKWTVPIHAAVHGNPTADDLAALKRAMDGLNAVEGFPGISLTDGSHNMDIWFVPLGRMASTVRDYVPGNWGFFMTDFDKSGITSATVAIATDVTDQQSRNHLIFEEMLQATGLMQDSNRYADSIYYAPWTTVQQPTALDWELLRMLYMKEIKHGMAEEDAMAVLKETYVSRLP